MKATVYKLKDNIDLKSLEELGFVFFKDNLTIIKPIKMSLDSGPVTYLLNSYYDNKDWKEKFYKKEKKALKKELGLEYDKEGQIIMSEKFIEMLTTWFIQIDTSDGSWIGVTSGDKFDSYVFYNTKTLDQYLLLFNNLIEEFVVEE